MAHSETDGGNGAADRAMARVRETEHRAKNTLQLIASVLQLQDRHTTDEAGRRALKSAAARIKAIGTAHRHTAWIDGREAVDLAPMIREIVEDLARSPARPGVSIDLSLEAILVRGDLAAPVALIVGETLGNALAHAYSAGQAGRIRVSLQPGGAGFELTVADDGAGLAEDPPIPGFGLTVAGLMARQIHGRLEISSLAPGVRATLTTPIPDARPEP